jgi:hypothetical protein
LVERRRLADRVEAESLDPGAVEDAWRPVVERDGGDEFADSVIICPARDGSTEPLQ